MNSPLISVIVPVYNKEKYVAKLIECIQAQSFRGYECIMVDDGSTDESGVICDSMTQNDNRFTVVHIQNGGVSHARNVALDMAKGEYITFADSDDELPVDYLQRIADDICLYKTDMVIGGIKKIFENGEETVQYPFEERVYTMQELLPEFAKAQQDCGVFGWCVNKTFRREISTEILFDETLKLCEDLDFFLKIYAKTHTVYFDSNNCYLYLLERGGFVATKDSEIDYLSQARIQIRVKKFLEENGVWSGENETVVSKRIQDYLFFTVFHSPKKFFDTRFEKAHMFYLQSDIIISDNNMFRRTVLKCISKNKRNVAKAIISTYKKVSGVLR